MLIGIGLGPGSPDLLTLAAIKALKKSRNVFVPGKLAQKLVSPYAKSRILDFPMILDKNELSKLWEINAQIVADEAKKGIVSFAVLGDPNVFSTFSHLKRTIENKYPEIEIITIPGVSVTRNIPQTGDYFSLTVTKRDNKKEEKTVYFVGAGPGNPKYITVRGRELLESADFVMYAGSLVNPVVLNYVRGEKLDTYGMKLEDISDMLAKKADEGKTVVRLHSGDPSLYGAIIEQMDSLKKRGIKIKIIPGVTSLFAAAAVLETQLTINGITETLIITRPQGMTLEKDSISDLSRHNATMAIYLGTDKLRSIMEKVEYPKDTPAAVVYHASWEDESVILGTVGDIADRFEASGIDRSAMIIIGNVLKPENYKRSHLYG